MSNHIRDRTVVQYANGTQFLHTDKVNSLYEILYKPTLTKAREHFLHNGLQLNTTKTVSFLGRGTVFHKFHLIDLFVLETPE